MSARRPGQANRSARALCWLVAIQLAVVLAVLLATVVLFAIGAAGLGPFAPQPPPSPTAGA